MTMTLLPVTLATAAALGLINLWIAFRIVRMRLKDDILIGDGGEELLAGRIRAHANLVEYAPFVLILMALIELSGGAHLVLVITGALFVAARIAHPIGMDKPTSNIPRAGGALLTWVTLAFLIGWGALIALGAV